MTDYLKEAETIHANYKAKVTPAPFNDAVVAFLFLFVRMWLAGKKTK